MQVLNLAQQRMGARRQRGMSFLGLVVWGAVIGFLVYLTMKVMPTVNEYLAVRSTVQKLATQDITSVLEIRTAFDKQRQVDDIRAVTGQDLDITKENGKVVIGFSYEKEIPMGGPVSLLIKYQGRTK